MEHKPNFWQIYKIIYLKKKLKFEKMAKSIGEAHKLEFAPPLKFGFGSLGIFIFILSFVILFLPFYLANEVFDGFPIIFLIFELYFKHIFLLAWTLFLLLITFNLIISIKYLDTDFFADISADFSAATFCAAFLLSFPMYVYIIIYT